jgi:DNA adenine methylase
VERARRLVIRSFMGFGSNGHTHSTGFRANSNRSGTIPAHDWINLPENLAAVIARLQGVVIESRPAMQIMATHDGEDTLHYADPPYVFSTRADLMPRIMPTNCPTRTMPSCWRS